MNWPSVIATAAVVAIVGAALLVTARRNPASRPLVAGMLAFGLCCGLAAAWLAFGLPTRG